MVTGDNREFELNEVSWWSKWAEAVWVSKNAYAIFSEQFDEWFFNRGGFLSVEKDNEALVTTVEKEFRMRRRVPCLFVQDEPGWSELRHMLLDRGYRASDQMSVMVYDGGRIPGKGEATAGFCREEELDEWSDVYTLSFYGDTALKHHVAKVVSRAVSDDKVGFVLAKIRGEPVGCGAVYRTSTVLGGYCIGTHPEFRERGVGTSILGFMSELMKAEDRTLVLQTILSDSVEGFYLKSGFHRIYSKSLLVKEVPS